MTFAASVQVNPDNARYFEKGILLPIKRYPLWQIQKGIVRTSTCLEDGTMVILGLWGPDDLVGATLTKVKTISGRMLNPSQSHTFKHSR